MPTTRPALTALGWVSAGSGRIDLTGKPLGEALYTRVALEQAEGPFLAVRPVNHTGDKHSPSAWKMTDAMTSWTWPGCEGKQAEVEVYARAASAALVLNGKEIARKNAKTTACSASAVRTSPVRWRLWPTTQRGRRPAAVR